MFQITSRILCRSAGANVWAPKRPVPFRYTQAYKALKEKEKQAALDATKQRESILAPFMPVFGTSGKMSSEQEKRARFRAAARRKQAGVTTAMLDAVSDVSRDRIYLGAVARQKVAQITTKEKTTEQLEVFIAADESTQSPTFEAGVDPIQFHGKSKTLAERSLSNWWPRTIVIDGLSYPTVEHYYHSQKFVHINKELSLRFSSDHPLFLSKDPEVIELIAGQGKKTNVLLPYRRCEFPQTWSSGESVKIMWKGVCNKFLQHEDLRNTLLSTNDRTLVQVLDKDEDGFWGSKYNILGKLLMGLRSQLRVNPIVKKAESLTMPELELIAPPRLSPTLEELVGRRSTSS